MVSIKKIISEGEKYGDIIVLKKDTNKISSDFSKRKIISTDEGNTTKLLIRISKNKKFGYATTSDFSKWKKCLMDAVSIMKASKKVGHEIKLSEPEKIKIPEAVYSKKIKELQPKKMVEKGYSIIDSVNKRLDIPMISISKSIEEIQISSSNGLNAKEKETLFSTIVETKSGEVTATEMKVSRDLFDPVKVGKESERLCIKSLNPKPIKTFKGSLILDYFAFSGILNTTLVSAVSADEIQSKKSILYNKLNEKVFSDKLNVTDNGLLKKGLMSGSFDSEGTPLQKTKIIENGIFKKPLYDIYSAEKDKTKSTGNCGGLEQLPLINPTNFIITPGEYSRDEIISETKQGVLAKHAFGLHFINPITGECSIGVESAFYVKNGKIEYPIKQAMVNFNIFNQLKKLEVIGKNLRQESSIVAPTVRFDDVQIIG